MKKRMSVVGVVFLLFAFLLACNIVLNPAGEVNNLIKNGSFESNGKPSLKYWSGRDSSYATFSEDTPKEGGHWAVVLPVHSLEPLNLRLAQAAELHSGKHILKLSFWAKYQGLKSGSALLVRQTADRQLILEKEIAVKDTVWTQYALVDTVQLNTNEKLYVNLSGGASELAGGATMFDLISLTEAGGGD